MIACAGPATGPIVDAGQDRIAMASIPNLLLLEEAE